jgi:ubiquinone/menaquinone biosynthesis C-methylase UbiE
MDLAEYRSASLDAWNRFAANWDEERAFMWEATRGVSERMVEGLDPSPGDTVLDLAAGPGETGFLVAERLGDEGRVISTDFAPSMVEAARRRGEELGLDRFEFRVLDAEKMDLDDDSVDGVVCRFGYMLMADPAAALAETRRVLRDGGSVAFAVWASPLQNAWAAIPGMTMVEMGHLPPPEPDGPGIFGLADTERIRELVTGAGFGAPSISQVAVEWSYETPEEHWEKTLKLAAPIAEAFDAIDPDEQERVKQTVAERVRGAIGGDGLGGLVHVVVAS